MRHGGFEGGDGGLSCLGRELIEACKRPGFNRLLLGGCGLAPGVKLRLGGFEHEVLLGGLKGGNLLVGDDDRCCGGWQPFGHVFLDVWLSARRDSLGSPNTDGLFFDV